MGRATPAGPLPTGSPDPPNRPSRNRSISALPTGKCVFLFCPTISLSQRWFWTTPSYFIHYIWNCPADSSFLSRYT